MTCALLLVTAAAGVATSDPGGTDSVVRVRAATVVAGPAGRLPAPQYVVLGGETAVVTGRGARTAYPALTLADTRRSEPAGTAGLVGPPIQRCLAPDSRSATGC